MQKAFVFSGFGGQGVMFAGQLLAYAAMDVGLHVTWIPSYGPEMRGGTAHCFVNISDKPIGSPVVSNPDIGLVFNLPSFDKYEPIIASNGMLVANQSLIPDVMTTRDDITLLSIPATDIAYEMGNAKLTNIILMGAMLAKTSVISVDSLHDALDNHIPESKRKLLSINHQALDKGANFIGSSQFA